MIYFRLNNSWLIWDRWWYGRLLMHWISMSIEHLNMWINCSFWKVESWIDRVLIDLFVNSFVLVLLRRNIRRVKMQQVMNVFRNVCCEFLVFCKCPWVIKQQNPRSFSDIVLLSEWKKVLVLQVYFHDVYMCAHKVSSSEKLLSRLLFLFLKNTDEWS